MMSSGPLGLNALLWAFTLSSVSFAVQVVCAATITVNANVGGAGCTLIRAIDSANDDSDAPGCAAVRSGGYGDDTILLPFAYNIHGLSAANNNAAGPTGLPSITSNITIQSGPGSAAIIAGSGTAHFRLIHVGAGGTLTLNDLMLVDGWATDNNGWR